MKPNGANISLTSYDDIFSTEENRNQPPGEQIKQVQLSELFPFKDHPFSVTDDKKMMDMVESVKEFGVMIPIIARPLDGGGYELVSGHRRKRACELAGLETMPVLIKNYTDDEAVVAMVDTNIQREDILPSEKAHAYRMKYDAMKHQGSEGGNTLESIGEAAGESGKTVQRYICLSRLSESLLSLVDDKRLPIRAGVELSYLKEKEQGWVEEIIRETGVIVSPAQGEKIRGFSQSKELTRAMVQLILADEKPKPRKVVLKGEKLSDYFPDDVSADEIEETIIRLLDDWIKNRH